MSLHIRRIIAGAIATASLLAFSVPALVHASSATKAHSVSAHAAKRHHRHHSRIPQHNGGDHDADNNGGPSDGDGNI
ncbi:MAG TPA: hypothetical protein VF752_08190 [Thermoleophilaceae bacterium]